MPQLIQQPNNSLPASLVLFLLAVPKITELNRRDYVVEVSRAIFALLARLTRINLPALGTTTVLSLVSWDSYRQEQFANI